MKRISFFYYVLMFGILLTSSAGISQAQVSGCSGYVARGIVEPGLQEAFCQAVLAWAPYQADVRQVRWCQPGECANMGGGMFHLDSRIISIDPSWPFKGDALLLTLEHEYGHALGLGHKYANSIMKPGWEAPLASGPTQDDLEDVRKLLNSSTPFSAYTSRLFLSKK